MKLTDLKDEERAGLEALRLRIGRTHVQLRLGLEAEAEARARPRLLRRLHPGHWMENPRLLHLLLRLAGLREQAWRNTLDIQLREGEVVLPTLPGAFDGFRLLHLSDLHLDVGLAFQKALAERVRGVAHDLCVITGDFRYRTSGPMDAAMGALAALRPHLGPQVLAVLGNHDSIRMVPAMEAMGVRVLLNESVALRRGRQALWVAGIDDPHHFQAHSLHKAAEDIPAGACSVLLSHAAEPYRQAAHCGFDLMLCGHTHGGQLCLPGGIPVMTCSSAPRALARGPWRHGAMQGYTSVGAGSSLLDVRLNCLPEITVHRLVRG